MTMSATLDRHLDWMAQGHRYFLTNLEQLSDGELRRPTALPGWTGLHLMSHVGYNAQALVRLVHWALSGERTPMYSSDGARDAEIELGAGWPAPKLRAFVAREQDELVAALAKLTAPSWRAQVVTAQGRTVPASTIPWLRTRELWIHASDLQRSNGFADFPPEFIDELLVDVLARRRQRSASVVAVRATDRSRLVDPDEQTASRVEGPAFELARWLTGRGGAEALRTNDGAPLPELPPWL